MPCKYIDASVLVVLMASLFNCQLAGESANSDISDEDVLALINDPDALLALISEEPQTSPEPAAVEPASHFLTASVRAGVGHSDNYLKKYAELEARNYIQIEMDAFASWNLAEMRMTALAFAEAVIYDTDLDPSEETLAFLQLEGILSKGVFDFGFEGSIMHGSFIYDSSLTAISVSSGTEVRQLLPRLSLFSDWYISRSNRIRMEFELGRAEFNLDNQDYWDPSININFERLWSRSLLSSTELRLSRQVYDDGIARTAGGEALESQNDLEVSRLALQQKLTWRPGQWKWLKMNLYLGLAYEDENAGNYEAFEQTWIQGRMTITNAWGQFRFTGKWGEYSYDDRQVSLYDPRLLHLKNQSLTIEYSRPLPWDLRIIARRQWNALKSRIYQDTYSERRTELLIEWAY